MKEMIVRTSWLQRGGGGMRFSAAALTSTFMVLLLSASPAAAFKTKVGKVGVTADFTLGYGLSIATQDADPPNLLGFDPTIQNNPSTKAMTTWSDAGDTVSNNFKALAEIGLDYENFGLVSNFSWNYDLEIMERGTRRAGTSADTGLGNSWANSSEGTSGSDFEVLDAYIFGDFEPADLPLTLRLGKQVINWGEGLFFMDGVSTQVPFNIAKLVLPGSELKEAFMGVGAIYAQFAPTDELSLEAYYQYEWEGHSLPGVGTFYGDDLLGPGAREEWANGDWATPLLGFPIPGLKISNKDASSKGQWGVSGKYLLDDWELGLYYSRYHHFFPQLEFMNNGFVDSILGAGAGDGLRMREVFPEDQDMFGGSFSTSLGMWSVNGEIAYRPDNVLMTDYGGLLSTSNPFDPGVALFARGLYFGDGVTGPTGEEHDTLNASVHGLGYYGAGPLGIDSNFYAVQLGWDYIDGDRDNLLSNANMTSHNLTSPDENAFGIAAQWDATWQNAVVNGLDITTQLFAQYDFSGNSHLWGNFMEDRLMSSLTVVGNYVKDWEASVSYARTDYMSDTYDSVYERQDTINFSVNYKF